MTVVTALRNADRPIVAWLPGHASARDAALQGTSSPEVFVLLPESFGCMKDLAETIRAMSRESFWLWLQNNRVPRICESSVATICASPETVNPVAVPNIPWVGDDLPERQVSIQPVIVPMPKPHRAPQPDSAPCITVIRCFASAGIDVQERAVRPRPSPPAIVRFWRRESAERTGAWSSGVASSGDCGSARSVSHRWLASKGGPFRAAAH